jgi:hypothetical protein
MLCNRLLCSTRTYGATSPVLFHIFGMATLARYEYEINSSAPERVRYYFSGDAMCFRILKVTSFDFIFVF